MKKILVFFLIMLTIISNTLPAIASWQPTMPFEIISGDESRVFVFIPPEVGRGDANAAVYEIINNERFLVYTVEGLSSFAYESNFFFSTDMMHFAHRFPESGMSAFEVFSNGARTRVVMRSDFIRNYRSVEAETSIGPLYKVSWEVEGHSSNNAMITINTDERNTILFDLASAMFITDDGLAVESLPRTVFFLTLLTRIPNIWILIASISLVVLIGVGIFLLSKRKRT